MSESRVSQMRSAVAGTMSAGVASGVAESLEDRYDSAGDKHVVQFYESDAFLVSEVSRFLGMALGGGDAAVSIATKAHREAFEEALRRRGLDLAQASKQGRYISLDAGETLSKFMIGGVPNREIFDKLIGDVILRAKKAAWSREGKVAAFGEMVALLSAEGNHAAAIRLEQLWNALREVHPFALRCAYPLSGFARQEASEPFLKVCAEHSRVLPAESYAGLIAEDEKQRAIAHLQQKAQALEAEVALRRSEERFRLLVEGVQDYAIYTLDSQGVITSWNEGARRIKGYTAAEIIGQSFARFYLPEDVDQGLPARILQTAREEGHYQGEGWRVRKDGSRFWSSVVVTPLRNDHGSIVGFSKITRDMTERKALLERLQRHAEELEKTHEDLRRLSGQLLQVQDDERRRLARELHDGAGQILAALSMNLESLQDAVKGQLPANLANRLAESIRLASQVIKESRTLSYLLHPPLLDEAGLVDALQWFVGGFIERSGIQTALQVSSSFPRLPRDLETTIFRIIQEALTNIHRHSRSCKASIHLDKHCEEIELVVCDEGKGLTPAQISAVPASNGRKLGVGIAGMRERVLQMGGRFEITAGSPGTVVKAVFPLRP